MNVLNNLLRKKSVKLPSLTTNMRDLVKTFAKYITETKNQIKERKLIRKDKETDSLLLKHKINEFIKNNFKEKGLKNDNKSFFLVLSQELYKLITSLLANNDISKSNNLSEESIISFIKSFYDFEDELYISSDEIITKIMEGKADNSYIIYLLICLSYAKLCEVSDFILDKENEISDIGVKIVMLLANFHSITKYLNTQTQFTHSNFYQFVMITMNHIIITINNFFIQFMDDIEMKTVFMLIEHDYLGRLFNDISEIKIIRYIYIINKRKYLFDLYIKVNIFTKDGIKMRKFKRYILENKCLEGILSNIKKNYSYKNFEDISEIFTELIYLLLSCNAFYENQKEIKQEVKYFYCRYSISY